MRNQFCFLLGRPLRSEQPLEENVRVPPVVKRTLAKSPLLPKSEAPIEGQRAFVVLLDAYSHPVDPPAREAGIKGGLQNIGTESLAPVIAVDEEREFDGTGFRPVEPQHDKAYRVPIQRFDDERFGSTQPVLSREPLLQLTRDGVQGADGGAPPPAAHDARIVEPAMEQGRIMAFDRAQVDRFAANHRRSPRGIGMEAGGS